MLGLAFLTHEREGLPTTSLPIAEQTGVIAVDRMLNHSATNHVIALLLGDKVWLGGIRAVHHTIECILCPLLVRSTHGNYIFDGRKTLLPPLVAKEWPQPDTNKDCLLSLLRLGHV